MSTWVLNFFLTSSISVFTVFSLSIVMDLDMMASLAVLFAYLVLTSREI